MRHITNKYLGSKRVISRLFFEKCMLALVGGFLFSSCNKTEDPTTELVAGYTMKTIHSDQRSFAIQSLNDSVGILVTRSTNMAPAKGLKVEYIVTTGGGSVTKTYGYTDINGQCFTSWILGNRTNRQQLTVKIYDQDDYFLSYIPVYAYGFSYNTWDTVYSQPDLNITDMLADSVHKISLMISGGGLYRQFSPYYNWKQDSSFLKPAYSIESDADNNYFIGTWDGEIYKSTDLGQSWFRCNVLLPKYNGIVNLKVTSNKYIWASSVQNPLYCSRNGGVSWELDTAGIVSGEQLGEIVQVKDGSFLLTTTVGHLYKSTDDGKSWTLNKDLNGVINLNITNDKNLLIQSNSTAPTLSLMVSKDGGITFPGVYSTNPSFWTSGRYNSLIFYKGEYLVLFPGSGIFKTKDFSHFSLFWENRNLTTFFKDANNVIIAKDLIYNRVFYRSEN